MGDNIALIRFHWGWELDGSDQETGLPRYKSILKITKSRPPITENTNPATDEDIHNPDYREAYEKFEREEKGRATTPDDGYPLVFWPAINPAEMMTCFDHGIYTVEQLARLPATRSVAIPAPILEIAKRAQQMLKLAKEQGKYEVIISELEGQIAAVRDDNNQMRATIQAQNTQLDILRSRMQVVA